MSTFNDKVNELLRNVSKEAGKGTAYAQADNAADARQKPGKKTKILYKTENVKSNYANFFKASAIREEVIINFGINHNWEHSPATVQIELNSRIILNPLIAKRLSLILKQFVKEYEKRFEAGYSELIERANKEAEKATKH